MHTIIYYSIVCSNYTYNMCVVCGNQTSDLCVLRAESLPKNLRIEGGCGVCSCVL